MYNMNADTNTNTNANTNANMNAIDNYEEDIDQQEEYENNVYRIVNNGGFNLNQPGNEGRYTRSHHFQNVEQLDSIFDHLTGHPHALYHTSAFIYNNRFNQGVIEYEEFPEIVYIPLPSRQPNFRRCILHVEEVDTVTRALTGRFFPVVVTYHNNHPIARAITRIFCVETHTLPFYQTNEDLVMLTSHNEEYIRQMASLLREQGNDFDAFDDMNLEPSQHVLPDPALVSIANRYIVIPDYDLYPREAAAAQEQWRSIVYPVNTTAIQRREMYATYAAEQINMHRYVRIEWGYQYPNDPNPIILPLNIDQYGNGDGNRCNHNDFEHIQENNPAERNAALLHLENQYIQVLYDSLNDDERASIDQTEILRRANENENQIPYLQLPYDNNHIPVPPVNHLLDMTG
jgi:hypothetical protein